MADGTLKYVAEFEAKGLEEVQAKAEGLKSRLSGIDIGGDGKDPFADLRAQADAVEQQIAATRTAADETRGLEAATGMATAGMAAAYTAVAYTIYEVGMAMEQAADKAALLAIEVEKAGIARQRMMEDFAAELPGLEFKDDVTAKRQDIARQMEDLQLAMQEQEIKSKPQTWLGKSFAGLGMLKDSLVTGIATGDFSLVDEASVRLGEMQKQFQVLMDQMNELDSVDQSVAANDQSGDVIAKAERSVSDQRVLRNADANPQAALDLLSTRYDELQDQQIALQIQHEQMGSSGSKAAMDTAKQIASLSQEMDKLDAKYQSIIKKQQESTEKAEKDAQRERDRTAKDAERDRLKEFGRMSRPTVDTYALREIGGTVGDPGRMPVGRDDPKFFQDQALQVLRNIETAIKENRSQNYSGMTSRGWED